MATIRELGERIAGAELDSRRFRGNVYIDGVAPWEELSWGEFTLGGAVAVGDPVSVLSKQASAA